MRVVIVGATGNVGTRLVQSLAAEPAVTSVLGIARRVPAWQAPKTQWVGADMTTDDLVRHFRDADVVVHLAWLIQPSRDPVTTWQTNVVGSGRIFQAVREAEVPALVYFSSVGTYSPGPKDRRVDETWPTHGWPTGGYTREKAYVERLLDAFELEHPGRRIVRLRPGFIFMRQSAAEQRRLFAGPFLPNPLVRPGIVPVVPDVPGLRFQALHAADAAEACRLAIVRPVRGAFNIAADPVLDPEHLAELLGARTMRMPTPLLRTAMFAAWRLRLTPASPYLFDAVLRLPIMDTTRAHAELGWSPRHSSLDAMGELLEGLRQGAGMETPPLAPDAGGPVRAREVTTGIGHRP
jgi:UDP-glucose 4-epimerase